jgi:hypothetical protein
MKVRRPNCEWQKNSDKFTQSKHFTQVAAVQSFLHCFITSARVDACKSVVKIKIEVSAENLSMMNEYDEQNWRLKVINS